MSEASKLHIRSWAELCNDVDLRDYFTVYIQVFLLSLDFDIFAFCSDISKQTRRKLKTKIWGKINFSYKPSFENLTFKLNKKNNFFTILLKNQTHCGLYVEFYWFYNLQWKFPRRKSRLTCLRNTSKKKCKQLFLKFENLSETFSLLFLHSKAHGLTGFDFKCPFPVSSHSWWIPLGPIFLLSAPHRLRLVRQKWRLRNRPAEGRHPLPRAKAKGKKRPVVTQSTSVTFQLIWLNLPMVW